MQWWCMNGDGGWITGEDRLWVLAYPGRAPGFGGPNGCLPVPTKSLSKRQSEEAEG